MNRETMQRIDALLEGSIDTEDFRSLQEEMRVDPEVLEHYLSQADVDARLAWELAHPPGVVPVTPTGRLEYAKWFLWVAAAITIGMFVVFSSRSVKSTGKTHSANRSTPPHSSAQGSIARLTSAQDARWEGPSPEIGDWLHLGNLRLTRGQASVTFDNGAEVQLQAPASLMLMNMTRAVLKSGKATVHIPDQAIGFALETPKATFREQGSRFAVAVDDNGETEIHVLTGFVELEPKSGDIKPLLVQRNQSLGSRNNFTVSADNVSYTLDQFPSRLPIDPSFNPASFLHWSFDSANAGPDTFRNSSPHGAGTMDFPARARSRDPESSHALVSGRFGSAIRLNGFGAFLETSFPGVGASSPRTVAFWLRIPPDTRLEHAYSIVSWGLSDWAPEKFGPGHKWQICWNVGGDNNAPLGAIRTEAGQSFNVGTTNLCDGRWHHVVSVFQGGKNARMSTHVRHYVDGRLEVPGDSRDAVVDTLIADPNSFPLTVGRRIENDRFRTFKGMLDELYVFPVALTPEQINLLYLENKCDASTRKGGD